MGGASFRQAAGPLLAGPLQQGVLNVPSSAAPLHPLLGRSERQPAPVLPSQQPAQQVRPEATPLQHRRQPGARLGSSPSHLYGTGSSEPEEDPRQQQVRQQAKRQQLAAKREHSQRQLTAAGGPSFMCPAGSSALHGSPPVAGGGLAAGARNLGALLAESPARRVCPDRCAALLRAPNYPCCARVRPWPVAESIAGQVKAVQGASPGCAAGCRAEGASLQQCPPPATPPRQMREAHGAPVPLPTARKQVRLLVRARMHGTRSRARTFLSCRICI